MTIIAWVVFVIGCLKLLIFIIQIFNPGAYIPKGNLPGVMLNLAYFILGTILSGMFIFK